MTRMSWPRPNPVDAAVLDQLVTLLRNLNMADPENKHDRDAFYASDSEGSVYWHIEQAAHAAAGKLTGRNTDRARELVQLCFDDHTDAVSALAHLRRQWQTEDPVGEEIWNLISRAYSTVEADAIKRLAVITGALWQCFHEIAPGQPCHAHNSRVVTTCEDCGQARP